MRTNFAVQVSSRWSEKDWIPSNLRIWWEAIITFPPSCPRCLHLHQRKLGAIRWMLFQFAWENRLLKHCKCWKDYRTATEIKTCRKIREGLFGSGKGNSYIEWWRSRKGRGFWTRQRRTHSWNNTVYSVDGGRKARSKKGIFNVAEGQSLQRTCKFNESPRLDSAVRKVVNKASE